MKPYSDPTMVICDSQMLDYHRNSENLLMPYMGGVQRIFPQFKA